MIFSVWRSFVAALYGRVGWNRARFLVHKIAPHLEGSTLLDLGAGTGHTAVLLGTRHQLRVTMLDVAPHRGAWGQRLVGQPIAAYLAQMFALKRVRYDGRRVPFENEAFDVVLIAFVLHHCERPDEVLREAARVSKGRVLVLEDGCDDHAATRGEHFWDALLNLEIFHPHQERKKSAWRQSFEACGLSVALETAWEWRLGYLRVPQTLFVLDKTPRD